ncbi:PREDICTED: protein FAM46C-like [Priapulus caudatus]|uniref:polynucleotide adenylyltransferase n=1 Tax=Priapulus caudatus TaxID=37621 RepID=A0ABM1EIA9_PRICU|nr:PREDICTED: protein FAM46C-like [Priapulus caudatus]
MEVRRLDEVMEEEVPIHGRGNFPTLHIKLRRLTQVVRERLRDDGIHVRDIRLNGGAANYVLAGDRHRSYNDLDLIFGVDLSNARDLERIKTAVLGSLLEFLPAGVATGKISTRVLKEGYVKKLVRVSQPASGGDGNGGGDRWSLISLNNNAGKHVELKFVDTMQRAFEFSVDSFQIVLDSLLAFYDHAWVPMSEQFYPTVVAESVYGDFVEALGHLKQRLIATRSPEEIRGGGLLKYCFLLARGYAAADREAIRSLERYMCSRFFIDFPDLQAQGRKLDSYLASHFAPTADAERRDYLLVLRRVIDDSTVCLMGHERRQILQLVAQMGGETLQQQQRRAAYCKQQQLAQFDASVHGGGGGHQGAPPMRHILQPQVTVYPLYQQIYYYYPSAGGAPVETATPCHCAWQQCS